MDDYTRPRRRIDPEPPRRSGGGGGGIPIFPLVLAVVFAGLLLGGLLAKFMGNRAPLPAGASPAPSVTPVAVEAPTPTLAPTSTPEPSGKPSPSPEPSASVTPRATSKPKPSATATAAPTAVAAATATPTARPSVIFVTPAPAPKATPAHAALAAAETPAPISPATTNDRAESVVRSYLSALSRGDEPSAASYLMSGLPNEKFMGPAARITSLNSIKNADGTFKVTADIQTTSGEYFETFNIENGPNGMQISDHYAIKP